MAIDANTLRDIVGGLLALQDTSANGTLRRDYVNRLLCRESNWVNAAAVAGTTAIAATPFAHVGFGATVKSVVWVPGAAVTANGSDFFTLFIEKRSVADAYAAATTLASRALSATNAVAFTPESLTIAVNSLVAGDIICARVTKTGGSGLAFPISGVKVLYCDT